MKRALRKGSGTSDDETNPVRCNEDDETDNEHHDSLPHDEDAANRPHKIPKNGKRARKPSIMDIIQLAKKEKLKETHPNELFKVNKNVVADSNDNDPEANMRIVSERRKSLLRRQPNVGEFPTQNHPVSNESNINYEIVDEKNKVGVGKNTTQLYCHSPSVEPEVFKFDSKSVGNGHPEQALHKKRFSSNIFFKRSNSTEPEKGRSTEDSHQDSHHQIGTDEKVATLSRGKTKLGSFLSLVREAVNIKKVEEEQVLSNETKQEQDPMSQDHKMETSKHVEVLPPAKVDYEMEDTVEEDKQGEETGVSRSESQRKFVMHRQPKRQDSQTSIWSDNIPVITISKTGSEECILENTDAETNGHKSKSKNSVIE